MVILALTILAVASLEGPGRAPRARRDASSTARRRRPDLRGLRARGTARGARRGPWRRRRNARRGRERPHRASEAILASNPKCFGAAVRDPAPAAQQPGAALPGRADTDRGAQDAEPSPQAHRARRDFEVREFGVPTARAKAHVRALSGTAMPCTGGRRSTSWPRAKVGTACNVTQMSRPFSNGVRDSPSRFRSEPPALEGLRARVVRAPPRGGPVFAAQLSGGAGHPHEPPRQVRRGGRRAT